MGSGIPWVPAGKIKKPPAIRRGRGRTRIMWRSPYVRRRSPSGFDITGQRTRTGRALQRGSPRSPLAAHRARGPYWARRALLYGRTMTSALSLGWCFHRESPSSAVVAQAGAAEVAGFDEFWVIEDCFFTSGPSLAAAALVSTDSIAVGIGIMPAVARNPAITAMEIATLCGLAPGRFHAGIGHGMADWMAQMGERRGSPLTMLEETLVVVRQLLGGSRVTVDGRYVRLDDVALAAPPLPVPLVSAGVRGPRSLAIAGRCADGVILADFCSPAYVRSTRELLAANGGGPEQRVTVFASMAVDCDGDAMRRAMAPVAAGSFATGFASLTALEFYDELATRAATVGWVTALEGMPPAWWSQIGAIGTPDDAAAYLASMAEAGTDCVAVFPEPDDPIGTAEAFARDVVPLLA